MREDKEDPTSTDLKTNVNADEVLETYWGEKIFCSQDQSVFSVGQNNFKTADAARKYIRSKSTAQIQRKS